MLRRQNNNTDITQPGETRLVNVEPDAPPAPAVQPAPAEPQAITGFFGNIYWANADYRQYQEYEDADEWYDLDRTHDRGMWSVGGNISAFFLGVGLAIDPMQLFNFVFGLVLVDFAYDDTRNQQSEPRTGPLAQFHKLEEEEEE